MELLLTKDGFTSLHLDAFEKELHIHVDKCVNASLFITYGEGREELTSTIQIEENASLSLLMKHDGVHDVVVKQNAKIFKDGYLKLAYCELDEGNCTIDSSVSLMQTGASTSIHSACIASTHKQFHIQCEHVSPYTTGVMENYAVVKEGANYRMEAIGCIRKGCRESASHQTTRVLTMSEKQISEVVPVLLIDENDVKASHATSLGQPDENQLYYLQTRGLSRDMALGLLTLGYLLPISELFEDHKIQEQLKNEIETKVGLHV